MTIGYRPSVAPYTRRNSTTTSVNVRPSAAARRCAATFTISGILIDDGLTRVPLGLTTSGDPSGDEVGNLRVPVRPTLRLADPRPDVYEVVSFGGVADNLAALERNNLENDTDEGGAEVVAEPDLCACGDRLCVCHAPTLARVHTRVNTRRVNR